MTDSGMGAADRAAEPTMRDIADRAGLSISTVSRALDPEKRHVVAQTTRDLVESIARELGYRPNDIARSLRKGVTSTVGIVVADITNPFVMEAIRGAEEHLDALMVTTLLAETRDEHARYSNVVRRLRDRRVDGILTSAARDGDQDLLANLAKETPVVLMLRTPPGLSLPAVINDDVEGGRLAARHLVDLGHRRLAHVLGPPDISSFVNRARGFREEALRLGVQVVQEWNVGEGARREEGERFGREISATDDRPSAVFAPTDEIAVGVLQGLRGGGLRCPDDVSVVGYYDSALAQIVDPPLTSVRLQSHEVGKRAAELLTARLRRGEAGLDGHEVLSLQPELAVRTSTCRAEVVG